MESLLDFVTQRAAPAMRKLPTDKPSDSALHVVDCVLYTVVIAIKPNAADAVKFRDLLALKAPSYGPALTFGPDFPKTIQELVLFIGDEDAAVRTLALGEALRVWEIMRPPFDDPFVCYFAARAGMLGCYGWNTEFDPIEVEHVEYDADEEREHDEQIGKLIAEEGA